MARSTVATDNFNRANGGLGSNWTTGVDGNDPQISSNQVAATSGDDFGAFWSADSFSNDQYSQITIATQGPTPYSGVLVRADASDEVLCQATNHLNGYSIFWYNGGSYTQIGSTYGVTEADGDVVVGEAEGTTFRLFLNGTQRVSGVNASAPSVGSAGLLVGGGTAARLDDWEGGDLVVVVGISNRKSLLGVGL